MALLFGLQDDFLLRFNFYKLFLCCFKKLSIFCLKIWLERKQQFDVFWVLRCENCLKKRFIYFIIPALNSKLITEIYVCQMELVFIIVENVFQYIEWCNELCVNMLSKFNFSLPFNIQRIMIHVLTVATFIRIYFNSSSFSIDLAIKLNYSIINHRKNDGNYFHLTRHFTCWSSFNPSCIFIMNNR